MIFLPVIEDTQGGNWMITEVTGSRQVTVRYRDENDTRKEIKIENIWPYCFVETCNKDYFDAASKEDGYTGLYGEELTKLIVPTTQMIRELNEQAKELGLSTWEANIPYVNRVLSDRLKINEPIANYNHRIWYIDCEWSPSTNAMRIIVVNDSFTNNEYVWFVDKDLTHTQTFKQYGDYQYETPALGFPTEREMLEHFVKHMNKQDPDILAGWYVVGADIKTIIERCRKTGVNFHLMSPMRRTRYSYGDWEQPIVGRLCIDLMLAVSKIWQIKNGKLPSYKLDDVAYELLKEKKIELPDGHDTYLTDLPLYLHYARQDVRLLPKLDLKVNAIQYHLSLQNLVQCDLRSTPFITKMFTSLALQDGEFDRRIPTSPQFRKIDYEGANVMEVESGVHDNVGILDIKAMYHSNASKYNISWETISDKGIDCGNGTKFLKPKSNYGMLVRQMDYMTNLRNKFKKLMKTDKDNYDTWDSMQFACKSLVASMYGVAGDAKYGMYHPDVAAAITYTSRKTLDELKMHCEDGGFKVHYGHTDSVFVSIPSPQAGQELIATINAKMSPIETEFEKWCSRMILMAKNRYAGRVTWSDGNFHDPNLYVKGIEMKQTRMPSIMKSCMTDVIDGILGNKDEQDITNLLQSLTVKVITGNIDKSELCMKGSLNKDISQYKVLSGTSAGAAWANEFLGKGYRNDSYFLVTLDDRGKYIAFDNPKEIEGKYNIGYKHLAQRFILKKIEPYYNIMGWDIQPIENSIEGIGHLTWL